MWVIVGNFPIMYHMCMSFPNVNNSKRIPRFVEEYCKDPNGTRAAIACGFPKSWAGVAACELLKNPNVVELIAAERARISDSAHIEAVDILREWHDVATADPSKLTRTRHVNCRHCWGLGNLYQWKAREYAEACDRANTVAIKNNTLPELPDCSGGFGYNRTAEPNLECPECDGEGEVDVVIADIETLTGPERKLFAGIKMTKNGPEVVMRDQDKARDNLAKYRGLLIDRKELTGKDGKPLLPAAVPTDLPTDPIALGALYSQIANG